MAAGLERKKETFGSPFFSCLPSYSEIRAHCKSHTLPTEDVERDGDER